jgi:hypothetical protein
LWNDTREYNCYNVQVLHHRQVCGSNTKKLYTYSLGTFVVYLLAGFKHVAPIIYHDGTQVWIQCMKATALMLYLDTACNMTDLLIPWRRVLLEKLTGL